MRAIYAFNAAISADNSEQLSAHFDRSKPNGSVDLWRLTGDFADPKRTDLVKTDFSITVGRGPQSMVIAQ